MFKAILNTFSDLVTIIFILAAMFLLGCENVKISERVVYEDGMPVEAAKVHQWTDEGYNGYTVTNENGTWTLTVPADRIIYLCIENPRKEDTLACYNDGHLLTPTVESKGTEMIKVDK